jgi:flagellar export protein FliJ
MARYQFRLKTVLKLREARRDQSRATLAQAFHAGDILAQNQRGLAAEQSELRGLRRAAASERYLDVNRLIEAQQYELVLRAREQELARQEQLLEIETERRRLALVEAERDVRVMQMLDNRQRTAHARKQRRAETRQLDEFAAGISRRGRRRER